MSSLMRLPKQSVHGPTKPSMLYDTQVTTHDLPLTFRCGLRLPNRVALAPMTNKQSHPDGCLGEDELRWLALRAEGGFGLISTCAAFVSPEAKAWDGQLGIAGEEHLAGLTRLAASLHELNAPSIVQLHHAGALATEAPGLKLGPCTDEKRGVRAATEDDLSRVEEDFVRAALLAQRAGMDGVEIHGANGYLFTQFLSPRDNQRADAFGGSLRGRSRFLRRTVRAVRAAVGPEFAVGVRISPVDLGAPRGLLLSDAVSLGCWLAEDGIDFLHLSLVEACCTPPHEKGKLPVVSRIRRELSPEVAVVVAGGIWTREDAERALSLGADLVALGRSGIAHPDWPSASMKPEFRPNLPPWTDKKLADWGAGPALSAYLKRFPGLVVGGRPA